MSFSTSFLFFNAITIFAFHRIVIAWHNQSGMPLDFWQPCRSTTQDCHQIFWKDVWSWQHHNPASFYTLLGWLPKDPQVIKNGVRPVVHQEVKCMMSCGTVDAGFEIYECPNCHKTHIICFTCKSRFCNSCGVKFAAERAEYLSNTVLDVYHRQVVFTIDERLRVYFKKDRPLLNALFEAAKDTIFYTFNKMNCKKKTFTPGFILTLHTFGRDLKWNPHIHVLLTVGAMDENSHYKVIRLWKENI